MWRQVAALSLLLVHTTDLQGVPSEAGMPLLGVRDGCISWARAHRLLSWRPGGAPVLSVMVSGLSWSVLQRYQDMEEPVWLLGSVFASPATPGIWRVPSGVGEARPGSRRVATISGPGQLPRAQLYYSFLPNKLKLYFFQSCSLGQAQVVYLIIYSFFFLFFLPLNYPPLLLAY